jgi:hypothetical protein
MSKVSDIAVYFDGHRYVVRWRDPEGNRFHYWSDDAEWLKPSDGTLYKNSAVMKYGEPGYFDTRRLDIDRKLNALAVRAVRDYALANKLVALAQVEATDRETKRLHEAQAAYQRDTMKALREFAKASGGSLEHLSDDFILGHLRSLWRAA